MAYFFWGIFVGLILAVPVALGIYILLFEWEPKKQRSWFQTSGELDPHNLAGDLE